MIMVEKVRQFLSSVSVWGTALLCSLLLLLVASLGFLFLRTQERPTNSLERTEEPSLSGRFFASSGVGAEQKLTEGLKFLYGEGTDEEQIALGIIDGWGKNFFGSGDTLHSFLSEFSGSPYYFVLREGENEHLQWLLSFVPPPDHDDIIDRLHAAFAERFPHAKVRTRTVPSGKMVEDLVFDEQSVLLTTESWRGVRIKRSTHVESGESFLTVDSRGILAIANDRELLTEVLQREIPMGQNMLFAHRDLLYRYSDIFPDSDILRHFRGMTVESQDPLLSLSSWACIP